MANNKFQLRDGTTLLDLTSDTVDRSSLAIGYTAHDKSGTAIEGSAQTFSFTNNGCLFQYPSKVVIPNTVTGLTGNSTSCLYSRNEIEEIYFESGSRIQYIPFWCFALDSNLKKITMPDSAQLTFQVNTFHNCYALEDVIFPSDTQKIFLNTNEFSGCRALKQESFENILAHIATSQTTLGNMLFSECKAITSVTLPAHITTLGNNVFQSCTSLTYAELPSVTSVGISVFSGCTALKTVVFGTIASGQGLTDSYASYNMFYNCPALEDIQIPAGWTSNMRLSIASNLTHNSLVAIINNLYDFSGGTAHTLTLGSTNLAKLSEAEIAVATAKNWTVT